MTHQFEYICDCSSTDRSQDHERMRACWSSTAAKHWLLAAELINAQKHRRRRPKRNWLLLTHSLQGWSAAQSQAVAGTAALILHWKLKHDILACQLLVNASICVKLVLH